MNAYQTADFLAVEVSRHFEQERGPAVVSVGNNCSWDIRWKNGTTCEVKVDSTASRTFNACVEFSYRDRPSGICTTKANLWIHCVPQGSELRCYEITVPRLRQLCLEAGTVRSGGEGGQSRFVLIPLSVLATASERDFTLKSEILKLMK